MNLRHLLILLFLGLCSPLYSQVTTASMNGTVTDEKGEGLIGATIVAKHLPSGTQYGLATNNDGRFTIQNMRVGGPYEVVVSYIGVSGTFRVNVPRKPYKLLINIIL